MFRHYIPVATVGLYRIPYARVHYDISASLTDRVFYSIQRTICSRFNSRIRLILLTDSNHFWSCVWSN